MSVPAYAFNFFYDSHFLCVPCRISITKACESLDASMTLSSMTQVDVAVGIAGTDSMWDTSVDVVSDAMNNGYNNIIDMGVHNSLASSLVTLVVKATPIMIASHAANTFTLSLDYLTSMHFLDNDKFLAVQQLMVDNQVSIPYAAYASLDLSARDTAA